MRSLSETARCPHGERGDNINKRRYKAHQRRKREVTGSEKNSIEIHVVLVRPQGFEQIMICPKGCRRRKAVGTSRGMCNVKFGVGSGIPHGSTCWFNWMNS